MNSIKEWLDDGAYGSYPAAPIENKYGLQTGVNLPTIARCWRQRSLVGFPAIRTIREKRVMELPYPTNDDPRV